MRDDLRAAIAPMRLLAVCVLALSALVALPATVQASRHQTNVLAHCSASALVRPLLGAPMCQTTPVQCPGEFFCFWRAEVSAQALLGLGMSAARVELIEDSGEAGRVAACTGPASGCTVATSPAAIVEPGTSGWARCSWEGLTIGVFARVDCAFIDSGTT